MRHLSIVMWIKVDFNLDTFTGLEFPNFAIFNEIIRLKFFRDVTILKFHAEIELKDSYWTRIEFVLNPLINCATRIFASWTFIINFIQICEQIFEITYPWCELWDLYNLSTHHMSHCCNYTFPYNSLRRTEIGICRNNWVQCIPGYILNFKVQTKDLIKGLVIDSRFIYSPESIQLFDYSYFL